MHRAQGIVIRTLALLLFLTSAESLLAAVSATGQISDETPSPVFSGPQPGEVLVPFALNTVLKTAGAADTDVVTLAKDGPLVIVFVHERTRPAFALTNAVMKFAATRRSAGLTAATVFLTADRTETQNWLQRISQLLPKDVIIGLSPDGLEGPGAYGLNRNVSVTVIVADKGQVTSNFALVQPGLDVDGPAILKAVAAITGGGEVPPIATFTDQGRMQMRPDAASPHGTTRGSEAEQDPMLRPLLTRLIRRDASDDQVDQAAQAITEYVAEHPAAGQQIADIASRIITADKLMNYGTPRAQQYLKTWSTKFQTAEPKKHSSPANDHDGTKSEGNDEQQHAS